MLTNNFFIWVFMATACVVAGFALSKGTTKRVYFFSGIGAGIVVLAVGIWSFFFSNDGRETNPRDRRVCGASV